jgi:hypothetical protein
MTLDELLDLFRQFNAQYFGSQVQIRSIEFTNLPENHAGRYDPQNNQILIQEGLCDLQQRITLLHEMIHKQLEQADAHGEGFEAALRRCAENSCSGFSQVILSEIQYVRDIDRFGRSRCDQVEGELMWLVTEKADRPWAEIRESAFEAIGLTVPEFAEIEEWSSALWDFLRGSISQRPPAPAVCSQKDTAQPR